MLLRSRLKNICNLFLKYHIPKDLWYHLSGKRKAEKVKKTVCWNSLNDSIRRFWQPGLQKRTENMAMRMRLWNLMWMIEVKPFFNFIYLTRPTLCNCYCLIWTWCTFSWHLITVFWSGCVSFRSVQVNCLSAIVETIYLF